MLRLLVLITALCAYGLAFADSPGPSPNPYQEYPPSCVAYPLPTVGNNDPVWSVDVNEPTRDNSGAVVGSEIVRFFFWRTPCDGNKSALIGLADRNQQVQGTSPAPDFPAISVQQGNFGGTVRVAEEPNTIVSSIAAGTALPNFQYFILENGVAANGAPVLVDYSQSLLLTIGGAPSATIGIPAYDSSQYPSSFLTMQISGYQTGNYADQTAGGQGVQIEVANGTPGQRVIVFAWYTYDASGTAYWLFNSVSFTPGARYVSLPLGYYSGGTFVGGSGTGALWGNVTVSFPDCDHLLVAYQSESGLPAGTPQGSGTRTFTRITSINGASCN